MDRHHAVALHAPYLLCWRYTLYRRMCFLANLLTYNTQLLKYLKVSEMSKIHTTLHRRTKKTLCTLRSGDAQRKAADGGRDDAHADEAECCG